MEPNVKTLLIEKLIGRERWDDASKQVRFFLLQEAMDKLRWELKIKHGSISNYNRFRIKNLGYKKEIDYYNEIAQQNGYMDWNDYLRKRYKECKENGLCTVCRKKTNKSRCEDCLKKARKITNSRYWKLRTKMLCVTCAKNEIYKNHVYCEQCLKEHNKSERIRYRKSKPSLNREKKKDGRKR